MSRKFTTYSHIIILLFLITICTWDRIINIPKFPFNFFYVTQLDLYINIIYYILIIKIDYNNLNPKLHFQQLFNFNFSLSFLVTTMFWGMLYIDKGTLFKKGLNIPFSLSFSLHGGVFIINFFEQLIFCQRKNPKYCPIKLYFIIALIYTIIIKILHELFDIKTYPFALKSIKLMIFVNFIGFLTCVIGHYIYVLLSKKKKSSNENEEEEELISTNI